MKKFAIILIIITFFMLFSWCTKSKEIVPITTKKIELKIKKIDSTMFFKEKKIDSLESIVFSLKQKSIKDKKEYFMYKNYLESKRKEVIIGNTNCCDTLTSVLEKACIQNDLSQNIISSKDEIINKQDTINRELHNSIFLLKEKNNLKDSIILKQQNMIHFEKNRKTKWKIVSEILTAIIAYQVIK